MALVASAADAKTIKVFSKKDSGRSTFRAAIDAANSDPSIDRIQLLVFGRKIKLKTPVTYTGTQALTINGAGVEITENGAENLLMATGGGDLHLKNISFVDALQSGVVVTVPAGNTLREQAVTLDKVTLSGNGWYGLLFDDQIGGDGGGSNSDSSLRLVVTDSVIQNNNNPAIAPNADDKDGIRVNEGGIGDITTVIVDSQLDENAAEGIELDEIGQGDVIVSVTGSSFDNNGDQPQLPSDLEDGLDVDEAGNGDIWLSISDSSTNGNFDEGLDLDEADEGNVYLVAVNFEASNNLDENVKVTKLQNDAPLAGSIVARFNSVTVKDSIDGDGIKLEVFDNEINENLAGSVFATVQYSQVIGNDSDDIQIEALTGELLLRFTDTGPPDLTPGIVLIEIP
ncbi:MAG: hypothetical protein AAF495_23265 [Pseudomonadota bacterium]